MARKRPIDKQTAAHAKLLRQRAEESPDERPAAIANLGEGVLITSDHLEWPGPQIVYVNEAMCRITGYAADELMGETPRIFQGEQTDKKTMQQLRKALSEKKSYLCELVNYRKDGTPYDAELFISPLFDSQGNHTSFIAIHRDISERKRADDLLRRANEFNENLINTAQTIVLLLDTAGRILQFNPYFEKLFGWRLDEVRSRDWFDTFLPDHDREDVRALFSQALAGKRTDGKVNTVVTKDGQQRKVEWYDAPLTDADGNVVGLLCSGQDITERLEALQTLRGRDERMQAILRTAADAIITINRQGIIDTVNPATEKMFGYTQEQLIGQNVSILMPPPYCHEHNAYIARYLQTGDARIIGIGREVVARRSDGSTFPTDLAVSEVDHLGFFTGVIRDVSMRRELQRQVLEIASEEDRRIGNELHDNIQQQLTGLGLLSASLAETLAQSSSQHAKLATRLADGIRETANDVHLLSRGLVPVEVDAGGLQSALSELASRVREQYGVSCDLRCEAEEGVRDNFVDTHLYRISQEAVNNAIKHGRCDHIEISLSGRNGSTVLEVLDDGIGIGDQRPSGTGMGLRIMDYRAALIGATVHVTPGKDGGTLVKCTVLPESRMR